MTPTQAKETISSQQACRFVCHADACMLNDALNSCVSQLLIGEVFEVADKGVEEKSGYVWGTSVLDGYKGWVPVSCLSPLNDFCPTHKVSVVKTLLYPETNIKSLPIGVLHFSSNLKVISESGPFFEVRCGPLQGYLWARHLMAAEEVQQDYVQTAQTFLNVPYLWGGRGMDGVDCSGLMQIALLAAGYEHIPRDSKDQAQGARMDFYEQGDLRRGDLVFWRGHVGLLVDKSTLLHASGGEMRVVEEPFEPYAEKQKEAGLAFLGVRRFWI